VGKKIGVLQCVVKWVKGDLRGSERRGDGKGLTSFHSQYKGAGLGFWGKRGGEKGLLDA